MRLATIVRRCGLVTLILFTLAASADTYHFRVTNGGDTITFDLPSNPIPDGVEADHFFFDPIDVVFDGSSFTTHVDFYDEDAGGGIVICDVGCNAVLVDATDIALFTGPLDSPTFNLGTFVLEDFGDSELAGPFTVSITTPEPASALLLGVGIMAVWRRRR